MEKGTKGIIGDKYAEERFYSSIVGKEVIFLSEETLGNGATLYLVHEPICDMMWYVYSDDFHPVDFLSNDFAVGYLKEDL